MPRGSNGGTTPLPEGYQWVPHVGRRQQMRELKRNWKRFTKALPPSALDEFLEAVVAVTPSADEELTCMVLANGCVVRARDTGKTLEEIVMRCIDELNATPRQSETWNAAPSA